MDYISVFRHDGLDGRGYVTFYAGMLRNFVEGLSRPRVVMFITMGGVAFNVTIMVLHIPGLGNASASNALPFEPLAAPTPSP